MAGNVCVDKEVFVYNQLKFFFMQCCKIHFSGLEVEGDFYWKESFFFVVVT